MEFIINNIVTYKGEKKRHVIIDIDYDVFDNCLLKIVPYTFNDLEIYSYVYPSEITLDKQYYRLVKLNILLNENKTKV